MGVEILQATFNARNEWAQRFSQLAEGCERSPKRGASLSAFIASLLAWLF